jgi:chaperone modulatory protein CbpM
MKTLDEVLEALEIVLTRETLENYISREWVRPVRKEKVCYFEEIDISRIQLIQQLRHDMHVGDEAMDVVLSLLDQMYGLRARMRRLTDAIERQPRRVQAEIFSLLTEEE